LSEGLTCTHPCLHVTSIHLLPSLSTHGRCSITASPYLLQQLAVHPRGQEET